MKCIHCNAVIKRNKTGLWVDSSLIFPQYCETNDENKGEQQHEPKNENLPDEILELNNLRFTLGL